MNLELEELKEKYSAAKLIVKRWEDAYKKEKQERPNKEALNLAPSDIKAAYKLYWKLAKQLAVLKNEKKTNTLVSSTYERLSNQEIPDSYDNESSLPNSQSNLSSKLDKISQPQITLEEQCNNSYASNSSNSNCNYVKKNENQKDDSENIPNSQLKTVWGHHLNKMSIISNENKTFEFSLYTKMAENMKNHAIVKTRTSLKRLPSKNYSDCQSTFKESEISFNSSSHNSCESSILKDISSQYIENSNFVDANSLEDGDGEIFSKLELKNCVVKKSVTKIKSQSVNHLSRDKEAIVNERFSSKLNENWVNRCTLFSDDPSTSDFKTDSSSTSDKSQSLQSHKPINFLNNHPTIENDNQALKFGIETINNSTFSDHSDSFKHIDNSIEDNFPTLNQKPLAPNNVNEENNELPINAISFSKKNYEIENEFTTELISPIIFNANSCNTDSKILHNKEIEHNDLVSNKRLKLTNEDCVTYTNETTSNENHDVFSINKEDEEWKPNSLGKSKQRKPANKYKAKVKRISNSKSKKTNNEPKKVLKKKTIKCQNPIDENKSIEETKYESSNNQQHSEIAEYDELLEIGTNKHVLNGSKRKYLTNEERLNNKILTGNNIVNKENSELPINGISLSKKNLEIENEFTRKLINPISNANSCDTNSKILHKRKIEQNVLVSNKRLKLTNEDCVTYANETTSSENHDVFSINEEDEEWKSNSLGKSKQRKPANKYKAKVKRISNSKSKKTNNEPKKVLKKKTIKCQNPIDENKSIEETKYESSNNQQHSEIAEYDELLEIGTNKHVLNGSKRKYLTNEERLNNKILTGKLNENFVRINLKKKIFVRGKRRMTSEKFKRIEWKKKYVMKKAEGGDERSIKKLTCYRCGDFGHWATKCPGKIGDNLLPVDSYNEKESTYLTIQEAANLAKGIDNSSNEKITRVFSFENNNTEKEVEENIENEEFSDWEDDLVASIELSENKTDTYVRKNIESSNNNKLLPAVKQLYPLNEDGSIIDTPNEVIETLNLFGHESFRKGQEEAIMRILSGQSTLVVQSTGSGKSLCYQLPAYLYAKHFNCITLCVSPLVSLMEDQVTGLPSFLKAVCLHTQQSSTNKEKALDALRSGNVHILLVSPEAVVSSSGGGVLGALLKELPPISFACLDEAHCLSEWSHNFRPSYLQVCQILKDRLNVNTFLGLTATARNETATSIARHLHISSLEKGVIMGTCIPDNLMLTISRDKKREEALIHLLTGERLNSCTSIIIYCTRREECERIATLIRTQMLTASQIDVKSNAKKQRGISFDAEAYHAGLTGFRRQKIQKQFMSGKLRIVVATVAFGMGIDKADVQGIIHFNMPRNLESYVQEIGRSGRDGNTAHCHLFLDSSDGKDIQELKRHIFVNSVDRFIVRKLLNKVFVPGSCEKANKLLSSSEAKEDSEGGNEITSDNKTMKALTHNILCPGHEIALPIESIIETLDLPEENIQTLLCYLENHPKCQLKLFHHAYSTCKVSCYCGPKQLCDISKKCPPLAVAIALQRNKKDFNKLSSISFPVVEIASKMGWQSRIVKQELKSLEWDKTAMNFKPSGVKVEFSDLAFHMTCRCDLTEEDQDTILEDIYERACIQEKDQLKKLQYTYEVLRQNSSSSIKLCCDSIDTEKSNALKETIREYFSTCNEKGLSSINLEEQLYIRPEVENHIQSDIRAFISIHSDHSWTGRAVARVLHGISSPNFPSKVWGRVRRFWRLHLETDFNLLVTIATKEILKFR